MSFSSTNVEVNLDDLSDKKTQNEHRILPKWLLEFQTFSISKNSKNNTTTTTTNQRPFTEINITNRPQWFKELAQRRSSDTDSSLKNDFSQSNNEYLVNIFNKEVTLNSNSKNSQNMNIINTSQPNNEKTVSNNLKNEVLNDNKINFKNFNNEDSDFKTKQVIKTNDFIIPELPQGKKLIIEIKTNWGDDDYVGLNGIEIFQSDDEIVEIEKIISEPDHDTNVSALIDHIYRTHDDYNIWLAPFTSDSNIKNKIIIIFKTKVSIALIRIWNYNKSRIYSSRGVRHIIITLDDIDIFEGEINKASGGLQGPLESFGDTILFTTDEAILENVAKRDFSFQELLNERKI